ncbi:UDP-N-acetylglucosamine 1-carboxyvinyltransferase [Fodinicola acaciae]|uniref:UDP-N-acetylglucosamine 1-carboxyvinyltransferase n=1 Tax=Fodinicola acaciae TaxID=2681555 RepID=UPI0013D1F4E1|nr:UDP-N-acetylglucosamine 1-carboxyvinyltransferase [Fodinicola acaciae]
MTAVGASTELAVQITGGVPLCGRVAIQGSKNTALSLYAAAFAMNAAVTLTKAPAVADTAAVIRIATGLGVPAGFNAGVFQFPAAELTSGELDPLIASRIRLSISIAAAVLARRGTVSFPLPGGDGFCERPIDRHLAAMCAAGATLRETGGQLVATLPRGRPQAFDFSALTPYGPSLGATLSALLLAAHADGISVLRHPSPEPEITHVCRFLRAAGVAIRMGPRGTLLVAGTRRMAEVTYCVPADRMEAGTLAIAAAVTGGAIALDGISVDQLPAGFREFLGVSGIRLADTGNALTVSGVASGPGQTIVTGPHPAFPTDLQPPATVLLARLRGRSRIVERVFPRRTSHLRGLAEFGVRSSETGHAAEVAGDTRLTGADVVGTDIRCAVAYVLAALAADGDSTVAGAYHLGRGHEDLPGKLRALGARIR